MSCCAARSPTRSPGSGSAASPWAARCPIPPPWSSSPVAWASRRSGLERGAAPHRRRAQAAADPPGAGRHHRGWANVAYPTDAGLLTRAIGKLATTIGRIQAAGAATRTRVRDRRRSARRRAHQLARTLRGRSEQAKEAVLGATGELADLAVLAVGDAARVAHNARRHLARAGEQASGKLD